VLSPFEEVRDLLVGGEALRGELRVHGLAVDVDLERPALGLDELDLGPGEGLLQLGGQTGRLGEVVSLHAVLDADLHVGLRGWKGLRILAQPRLEHNEPPAPAARAG
jgi:hypothetical protein